VDQNLGAYREPRQVPSRGPLMRDSGEADSGAMASQAFTLVGRIMEGPEGPVKQCGQWAGNAADKVHSLIPLHTHGSHEPMKENFFPEI